MAQSRTLAELENHVRILEKQIDDLARGQRPYAVLRESEARFRAIFELAPNPICLERVDNETIIPNRAMCELFGYSVGELSEKTVKQLMHPDDVEGWLQKRSQILMGELLLCQVERRYVNKKGDVIWGITAISLLKNTAGGPAFVTVQIQNISYIKAIEEKLLQARKMKAITTLAGGVAHDFNNILMGIQGRVSLMLLDADPEGGQLTHLKKIEEHIRRAANLTNQLLGFARGGRYVQTQVNINQVIQDETGKFARTWKAVSIVDRYAPDLWSVKVDPIQLRQVLSNVYTNACQAMPEGGTLTISTQNIRLTTEDDKPMDVSPGRYVQVSVTDTGVGMDPETRQRIFEPFFTTRPVGKGVGLGLAYGYGVIRNHGGFINVDSEKGQGTTVSIFLPAMDQDLSMDEKKSLLVEKGRRVVLLVDDEEMITEIGRQMIARLGYTVLTAGSGAEALRIFTENKEKVDLVILDMIMPDMGGEETYDALRSIDATSKVVLSSGYTIDERVVAILNRGGVGFIQKPFGMNQLADALKSALTSPG